MARRGATIFRARSMGFDSLVRDADESIRTIVSDTRFAVASQQEAIVETYRRFAPEESGRLKGGIQGFLATLPGGAVQLRVAATEHRDPATGYDYLEQTDEGRGPVTVLGNGRLVLSLGRNRQGVPSERRAVGKQVRGWSGHHWTTAAGRRANRQVDDIERELGRRLSRHGLTRGT